jgi:hypothetical protein
MPFVGDRGLQDKGIGAGRPIKTRIDYDELCRMMQIQCTQQEIAYLFGVSVDALHAHITNRFGCNYTELYKEHSTIGKRSLRRELFRLALDGKKDADRFKAAQWLSKQHLGMKDQVQTEIIPMTPYMIRTLEGETIKLGADKPKIEGDTDAHSDTLRSGDDLQPGRDV